MELTYPDRPSRCETRYRKLWLSTTQDGTTSGVNMQVSPKKRGGEKGETFLFFVLVLITFPFLFGVVH